MMDFNSTEAHVVQVCFNICKEPKMTFIDSPIEIDSLSVETVYMRCVDTGCE